MKQSEEINYILISILIFIAFLGVLPLELLKEIESFNLLNYNFSIAYFLAIYLNGVYFIFIYYTLIDFRKDLTLHKKLLLQLFWFFYILRRVILILKEKIWQH